MSQSPASVIVWFDLPVIDLDRAIRFYEAVLAVKIPRQEMGPGCAMGILPHTEGTVGGCLAAGMGGKPTQDGPLMYLNCAGRLDAAIAKVTAEGGKILQAKFEIPPHGFCAIVVDTEGNRVALHSHTA